MKKLNLIGRKFNHLTVVDFSGKDDNDKPLWKCKCDCGNYKDINQYYLQKNAKSCGCRYDRKDDLTNKKFGKLTILQFIKDYKGKRGTFWKCKCECGNETFVRRDGLTSGRIISCGCAKYNLGKNNHSFKGHEELSATLYNGIKREAKYRNKSFDISMEYLWQLFVNQNRKCSLTGLELTFSKCSGQSDGTASLDRIDSTKGYIEGNVQWVHKKINMMKQTYSQDEFVELCKMVTEHNA